MRRSEVGEGQGEHGVSSLFRSVIWPAIAGNVAWAFFSVLLLEWADPPPGAYWSRLALLGAMAAYLSLDWMHTESIAASLRKWYWIGDLFLAVPIAALAIAAQAKVGDGRWFLLWVFATSAVFQLLGTWTPDESDRYSGSAWKHRLSWLGLNLVAAGIAVGYGGPGHEWGWHLFVSAALVVVCWALAKVAKVGWFRWLG